MKKSKSEKMYGNPPTAETDEKGHTSVKEPSKADKEQSGTDGVKLDTAEDEHKMQEMHHRHEMEHMTMNRRHEVEMQGGDKASMIEKHITEHKEMSTRHLAEMKKSHGKGSNGEKAKDVKGGVEMPEEGKKKAKAEKGGEKE